MIGRHLLTRAKPPAVEPMAMTTYAPWPLSSDPTFNPYLAVTEDEALDLAVVAGFLNVLCALILQMPLGAFTGTDEVPAPPILRNPTPGPNRVFHDFVCEYVRDMALHGNYLAVLGDPSANGWPDLFYSVPYGMWLMRPDGYYQIGSDVYRPADVFHVKRGCRSGEMVGRGLLESHRRLLAGAVSAERFAQAYFDGGTAPPAVLTSANPELTQDQADLMKAGLRSATRKREAVIVPSGTTVTPLNADADGAQLIEQRRWGAVQLAMAMGIPGAMLGLDSPSLTYRNITDVFDGFLRTTVMSYLVPLEQQFTLMCLPRTMAARFDPSAVLRPDLAARVDLAAKGLVAGLFKPNEARAMVDLPPDDSTDTPDLTDLATAVQKLYLGVGKVITADEARGMLNSVGAELVGSLVPSSNGAAP